MNFYASIADNYDYIFPFNSNQLDFIVKHTSADKSAKLLEIGSATGILTSALNESGFKAQGLELDAAMVDIAKAHYPTIDFVCENMLNINDRFSDEQFQTLVCFGNTLVHLDTSNDMSAFLAAAATTLSSKGKLLVQFINYDRIIDQQVTSLSTIENEHITFVRNYVLESAERLLFNAELTVHKTQEISKNTQVLYPLRKDAFEAMAQDVGFSTEAFGSFKGDKWTDDSLQSIFVCTKE